MHQHLFRSFESIDLDTLNMRVYYLHIFLLLLDLVSCSIMQHYAVSFDIFQYTESVITKIVGTAGHSDSFCVCPTLFGRLSDQMSDASCPAGRKKPLNLSEEIQKKRRKNIVVCDLSFIPPNDETTMPSAVRPACGILAQKV